MTICSDFVFLDFGGLSRGGGVAGEKFELHWKEMSSWGFDLRW